MCDRLLSIDIKGKANATIRTMSKVREWWKMVLCYLLESVSVNIDVDWLLRILANFLLIKKK